jgi:hypothetical protein
MVTSYPPGVDSESADLETSPEMVKQCLHDLYVEPRNNLYEWSKITEQTAQVRLAYPGEHLACVITGVKGSGSAARGDDLSDGTEVKSCSRADQLSECRNCGEKVLVWQEECPACGSEDINIKTDSHWIFSIRDEKELNLYLNKVPRLLLLMFDRESPDTDEVRLRAWSVDPDQWYYRAFIRDYWENNYKKKKNQGKDPAPLNLHPEKYDFYMMEPELVFHAALDIEEDEVEIVRWDFEDTKKEPMPTEYPNTEQVKALFSETELINRVKEKIPRNRWDEFLYKNNKNKLKNLSKSQYVELYPTIPEEKRDDLQMKDKTTREYKEEYRRRE